jgi:hypothetical protein
MTAGRGRPAVCNGGSGEPNLYRVPGPPLREAGFFAISLQRHRRLYVLARDSIGRTKPHSRDLFSSSPLAGNVHPSSGLTQ